MVAIDCLAKEIRINSHNDMSLTWFSTWATGVLNGYQKENPIPASYKYTIMGITAAVNVVKALGSQTTPIPKPALLLPTLCIGVPLITGSVFCVGTMFGKSVRHLQDSKKDFIIR